MESMHAQISRVSLIVAVVAGFGLGLAIGVPMPPVVAAQEPGEEAKPSAKPKPIEVGVKGADDDSKPTTDGADGDKPKSRSEEFKSLRKDFGGRLESMQEEMDELQTKLTKLITSQAKLQEEYVRKLLE